MLIKFLFRKFFLQWYQSPSLYVQKKGCSSEVGAGVISCEKDSAWQSDIEFDVHSAKVFVTMVADEVREQQSFIDATLALLALSVLFDDEFLDARHSSEFFFAGGAAELH